MQQPDSNAEKQRRLLEYADNLRVPEGLSEADALLQVQARIAAGRATAPTRLLWPKALAAAATLLLLLGVFWQFGRNGSEQQYFTGVAEHKSFTLPDGSSVVLDASSELRYNAKKWSQKRHLHLQGRAHFDVVPGNDFVVNTPQAKVRVLGTRFDVHAREGLLDVVCYEGKVSVQNLDGESLVLMAGDEAQQRGGQNLLKGKVAEPSHQIAWKKGMYYFDNSSLKEVIAELNRQFGIEVEASGFEQKRYTGFFSTSQPEKALKSVCAPLSLEYVWISDTSVRLRQAGD